MNKLFKQGMLLFRRVSVFYMFFLFLILAFILYQYKVKPDNEAELQDRGQRVLNQLVQNFIDKNNGVKAIFDDPLATYHKLYSKDENLEKLEENVHYTVDSLGHAKDSFKLSPFIKFKQGDNWQLIYPKYSMPDSLEISVKLTDFAKPLFGVREDIFSTFLLLLDTNNASTSAVRNFPVIYSHDDISTSPLVNLDTLRLMQKNSDQSVVTSISISGNQYKIFVCPFRYYNQRVLMTGLIPSEDYARQVNITPITFIPVFIISILLLLIFLPFLKLFFLSPHESVNIFDLRAIAISMYAGSAIFILIVFYLLSNVFLRNTYNNQLSQTGKRITQDINKEIKMANQELNRVDELYPTMTDTLKKYLAYDDQLKLSKEKTDSFDELLTPRYFKNASRIFWLDSSGQTLAKWNAFDFVAPLTSVQTYDFFKRLKDRYPKNTAGNNAGLPAQMYCGKSNSTNEFQVYFSKPSTHSIYTRSHDSVKAFGLCLAGFLSCSNFPIIPAGFGFCIINNTGEVLIHSDPRRNLSENILEESENNTSLLSALQNKNGAHLSPMRLYGAEVEATVMPIKDQSLYVVTFYNKKNINNQILQTIQFAALLFISMYACVLICLWFATYSSQNPVQLLFRIHNIEWIRPSQTNDQSYSFTINFFIKLGVIYLAFLALTLLVNYDLTLIVYLSLLLPFYAVLGYIFARKKDNSITKWKVPRIIMSPLVFIGFVNVIIFLLLIPGSFFAGLKAFLPVCIFQAMAFTALYICDKKHKRIITRDAANDEALSPDLYKILYKKYFHSLGYSILLITLFPVAGFLIYSWSAQSIQLQKNNLLKLASEFEERHSFFKNEMPQDYKSAVYQKLESLKFSDSLTFYKGIYLPGETGIEASSPETGRSFKDNPPSGDELYYTLNEHLYLFSGNTNLIPLQDTAWDNSWQFYKNYDDGQLKLHYTNVDTSIQEIPVNIAGYSETVLDQICQSGFLLLLLIGIPPLLFVQGKNLIKNIISRLFLQNYNSFGKSSDPYFLPNIFRASACKEYYLEELNITTNEPAELFKMEWKTPEEYGLNCTKEELIIAIANCLGSTYETIWQVLSEEEQYVLFDFVKDRLTNYKNTDIINRLMRKGILANSSGTLDVFSLSFRNYILSKAGTPAIEEINNKYELPGVWSSIKIPAFSLMSVIGIFILFTQSEVTHRITGFLASITALLPLLLSLLQKKMSKPDITGSEPK